MKTVKGFASATVGNVACGFDVLGFALVAPGFVEWLFSLELPLELF